VRRLIFRITTTAVTVTILIGTLSYLNPQTDAEAQGRPNIRLPIPLPAPGGSLDFARTELFFGTAKPDGGAVSDAEFAAFVDTDVTPLFPDGVTVVEAHSQFRDESSGVIIKEKTFLIILLYPVADIAESSGRIETIRQSYEELFQQASVMRVDSPFAVRVSF